MVCKTIILLFKLQARRDFNQTDCLKRTKRKLKKTHGFHNKKAYKQNTGCCPGRLAKYFKIIVSFHIKLLNCSTFNWILNISRRIFISHIHIESRMLKDFRYEINFSIGSTNKRANRLVI